MTKCFEENKEATELVLRIVLEKADIQVENIITQYSMKNIKGRSVRLDIYDADSQGKKYNIEIQRAGKGGGTKRARYNSSLIDSDILPVGVEVENLAETYVIFITETDVIGKNANGYCFSRIKIWCRFNFYFSFIMFSSCFPYRDFKNNLSQV